MRTNHRVNADSAARPQSYRPQAGSYRPGSADIRWASGNTVAASNIHLADTANTVGACLRANRRVNADQRQGHNRIARKRAPTGLDLQIFAGPRQHRNRGLEHTSCRHRQYRRSLLAGESSGKRGFSGKATIVSPASGLLQAWICRYSLGLRQHRRGLEHPSCRHRQYRRSPLAGESSGKRRFSGKATIVSPASGLLQAWICRYLQDLRQHRRGVEHPSCKHRQYRRSPLAGESPVQRRFSGKATIVSPASGLLQAWISRYLQDLRQHRRGVERPILQTPPIT